MNKLIEKKHFVCTDLEKNSNKYWIIERFDDNSVKTSYGRVGDSGQSTTKNFSSTSEAEKFFNTKVKEKSKIKSRRDAYTEIHILDDMVVTKSPTRHISDLAAEQIETSSEDVRKLVRWFSDINIHNIVSSTSVSYNITEGCFRTPLGVVDQSCISNAKVLLNEISQFPDKETKECLKKINLYLRYVPQDLGSSHQKIQIKNVFGSGDLLQKQADILEGLEAAISSAKPSETNEVSERVFNTKLDIVKNEDEISKLKERFASHCNYSRINGVYTVSIKDVVDRFVTHGLSVGNRTELWHATNPRNILSIFKSGLIIPTKYSNGWNHGAGIYFSDRSSKSMKYLSKDNRNGHSYGYMFVGDVALGNVYYDEGNSSLDGRYNCRWAYKGQSDSQIIVYNTGQVNLLYLLEIV
jgi:predicted DNA-binding WGR domain protein